MLNYRKPSFWVVVVLIIVAVAISIGLAANPIKTEPEFESITTRKEIASAEELWKARTKYIGDNSAVGQLIGLLPIPEGLQYDHFKLHTSERPYVLEIVYSTSTETLKYYDKEEKDIEESFGNNAILLLALIDNADQISTIITDGKLKKGFINVREWADDSVGRDVRHYAKSPEKLQELIDFLKTDFTRQN